MACCYVTTFRDIWPRLAHSHCAISPGLQLATLVPGTMYWYRIVRVRVQVLVTFVFVFRSMTYNVVLHATYRHSGTTYLLSLLA